MEFSMAEVTVFVDDAVLDHLPAVCVKDGLQTDDRLTVSQDVGGGTGMGVAWLLVLAGPIGWIGLFFMAAARRGEVLTVTLPLCEADHLRWKGHVRARWQATLVLASAFLVALVALAHQTTDSRLLAFGFALLAAGALVKAIIESSRVRRSMVRFGLDVSRRWVTMWDVHPNFQESVDRGHDHASRYS